MQYEKETDNMVFQGKYLDDSHFCQTRDFPIPLNLSDFYGIKFKASIFSNEPQTYEFTLSNASNQTSPYWTGKFEIAATKKLTSSNQYPEWQHIEIPFISGIIN